MITEENERFRVYGLGSALPAEDLKSQPARSERNRCGLGLTAKNSNALLSDPRCKSS